MKKALIERNLVVLLFIVVLVTFSFAERDSKKLEKLYTSGDFIQKSTRTLADLAAKFFPEQKKSN